MQALEIGKRYEFLWPKDRPCMRMIGSVVELRDGREGRLARIDFGGRTTHVVQLEVARVREASDDEPGGWWAKILPETENRRI